MKSTRPLDCLLAALFSLKDSVKQATRFTIFVVDKHIQKCVLLSKRLTDSNNIKLVGLEGREFMLAIFN
jgi:hypothetical protein